MNFVRNEVNLWGFLWAYFMLHKVWFLGKMGKIIIIKNVSFTICKLRTGEYRKRIGQWETNMQSSFSNRCNLGRQWYKLASVELSWPEVDRKSTELFIPTIAMLAAAPAGILTVMLLFSPQLYSETGLVKVKK